MSILVRSEEGELLGFVPVHMRDERPFVRLMERLPVPSFDPFARIERTQPATTTREFRVERTVNGGALIRTIAASDDDARWLRANGYLRS